MNLPNGEQRPSYQNLPLSNGTAGEEAVELAASAGLLLDPWQAWTLQESLAWRVNGKWAARDVGLIVSRQNGKGSILEARELAGLFLLGERELVHTAHLFKTSSDHFLRIKGLIESTPDLMRDVQSIKVGNTDPGILLKSGARLRFVARSVNGSGRGFAKIDFLCLDEAYDIPRSAAKSLLPTQLAAANPQTWYTSSVEDRGELTDILRRLRDRGRLGNSPNLFYAEWSAPEGSDPDDWYARAKANPGLGIRLDHDSLQSLRDSLGDDFIGEHLSIWPKLGVQSAAVFGAGKWEDCQVESGSSRIARDRCFGIAVSLDRMHASIGAAGQTERGQMHVEPITHADGVDWVVGRALELQRKWAAAVVIDSSGPSKSLIQPLELAGVKLTVVDQGMASDACASIFDAVQIKGVVQMGYPELDAAVAGAEKHHIGDRWVWKRKSATLDISPLEAVTLAAWGSRAGLTVQYDAALSVG